MATITKNRINTLNPLEKKALAQFVSQLEIRLGKKNFHVSLFGSKARGDFDKESDIDLLVVLSDTVTLSDAKSIIRDIANQVSLDYGVLLVNIVISHSAWEDKADYSLFETIRNEGILL
jgi:uncharacterized protein